MNDSNSIVYLDHNATTPIAGEVVEAMLPFLTRYWGNPSSAYSFGHEVANHLDHARRQCADLIGAEPRQILFTSCGTESINSAMHAAGMLNPHRRHLVLSSVEHSAGLNYAKYLQRRGFEISYISVDANGALHPGALKDLIRPDTAMVSVMWANNETGILYPVEDLCGMCRERGVLFHTDAVQVAGKIPMDAARIGVDFLSLSGHKFQAPKGIGLLYIKDRHRYTAYVHGGGQEKGKRGGTENVPYIVGLGKAAELAQTRVQSDRTRVAVLRNRLEDAIMECIPRCRIVGKEIPRLDNTSNILFEGVEAEAVLLMLDRVGICASSGSACTTGSLQPSHVLTAMGIAPAWSRGAIRFSLGMDNTEDHIDYLLAQLPAIVSRLRGL